MDKTIGAAFAATVEAFPERTFLTDGHQQFSFREAAEQCDRIAEALLGLGLTRHDRVALWLPNSPQWVLIALACAKLGILIVPINTRNKAEETRHILAQSKVAALVMVGRYWDIDYCQLLSVSLPSFDGRTSDVSGNPQLPDLRHVIVLDGEQADFGMPAAMAPSGDVSELRRQVEADVVVADPAVTVFTSGTTGYPKGAVHSHIILRNCMNIARAMHVEPGDVILGHMPFYHIAGLCTALFPAAILGCTLLTVAHWQPRAVAELIAGHKVNIFGGIPTHFIDLADAIESARLDTSCLKSAWIGGATVTPEVARRAKQVTQLTALQSVYGMTETTSTTVLSAFEDPIEIVCENKGKPIGDFEVAVVDPETGDRRPTGEDGEIRVRGHIVMSGYLDDPEATANVMTADGWFKTGDIGRFDDAGYLQVTGRLKEMFIVGGTNAYPAEIERCLQEFQGVRQVVVVGVPEPRLGEVGFAFIQRSEDCRFAEADVIAFARARLADYKVPRHVRFVESFPLTSTNKIQRHVLAAQAEALLRGPEKA